ncbi:MAG: DUF1922 domain-containing protein [Candidatus Bathyarchaeota archaeon]|nr:DUF1922 domain-containing protein [Candidatus Termiticorpusculum sp.]
MAPTLIIKCPYCAGLFLSGSMQKSRLCSYCGRRVNLERALCVARTESAVEASELLKQLKVQSGRRAGLDFRCV